MAATALFCCVGQTAVADRVKLSLEDETAEADAIVVGKVAEIESRRYSLTLFEKGSDGKKPAMTTLYDLAVLHPETVIKADCQSMVNKADRSNPIAWMHMGFETPDQPRVLSCEGPTASIGQYRIWFLRRDMVLTGNYFLHDSEPVTDAKIREVKKLVASRGRTAAPTASKESRPPLKTAGSSTKVDTPEIIRILEQEAIKSIRTSHSQHIYITLKDGHRHSGIYEHERAGKYSKDRKLSDILNLVKHIMDNRPKAETKDVGIRCE